METFVGPTELRARFALSLSDLYGLEVPAYTTLVQVSQEVNQEVLARSRPDAERLGTIARVTAERHGAIRVGSPRELAQVARIFGALGMYPTGFYDLRDAAPAPIPVVSTAFRPQLPDELARNPFRVFTSMLVPEDRRFFDPDLEHRLTDFIAARRLFGDELLALADRAEADGGLPEAEAETFLQLATASFALSSEPVDRAWYAELEAVSGVAADIGGVTTTHINHLTPRVLDIDELYRRMQARGIEMIDAIQGPPRSAGTGVLLRQTSFRALAEPRTFREADGSIVPGTLRIRFGEVEARGIALTAAGRERYDRLIGSPAEVWAEAMPDTEDELRRQGLAFFSYRLADPLTDPLTDPQTDPLPAVTLGDDPAGTDLDALIGAGRVIAEPIVYEDFLPRSAAGIFSSNLSGAGTLDAGQGGAERDAGWLSRAIGREVAVPETIYAAQSSASLRSVEQELLARSRTGTRR